MVRAGRALLVGAAIGRASARRHQDQGQQEVVVVTTQPTAAATTTTTYTTQYPQAQQTVVYGTAPVVYGGQPAYGVPATTTTTVYSHSAHAQPAAVVVTQGKAAKSKKRRMACMCVCLFVAALVLCVTLVPWPGTRVYELVPGEQAWTYANGLFIESAEITTFSNYQPVPIRAYSESQTVQRVSFGPLQAQFVPTQSTRTNQVNTYLNYNSDAIITVTASPECSSSQFTLYIIRGESRYDDFVNYFDTGGGVSSYVYSGSFSDTITIYDNDVVYFVVYNPSCSAASSQVTLTVNFVSFKYPYGTPSFECDSGACVDQIPYGEYRYYIAEVPFDADPNFIYESQIYLRGNTGAYVGLYVGLFGGMILCAVVMAIVAKKKEAKEAQEAEDAPNAPLLGHAPGHHQHVVSTNSGQAPPNYDVAVAGIAQAPYQQPAQYQQPAPYQQAPYQVTQAPYPVT